MQKSLNSKKMTYKSWKNGYYYRLFNRQYRTDLHSYLFHPCHRVDYFIVN